MCEMMQRTHSMLEHQTAVLAMCEKRGASAPRMQVCVLGWIQSLFSVEALCRRKPLCECRGQGWLGHDAQPMREANEYGLSLHSPECGERVWCMDATNSGLCNDPLPRPCRDSVYGISQSNWAPTHGLRHTGEIERGLSKPSEIRWNMRNPRRSVRKYGQSTTRFP